MKKLAAAAAVGLALLTLSLGIEPALARHGHGGFVGGGTHFGHFGGHPGFARLGPSRYYAFRHHRHFRHGRFVVAGYPYAYGGGCYWLKQRALYTGSPYWWRRYRACRYGYSY
jgi:hypothetical protein